MIKKLLTTTLISSVAYFNTGAQTLRASLGMGSSPNRVTIYVMCDADETSLTNISTLQFTLALPAGAPDLTPTVTMSNVPGAAAGSWSIDPVIVESGFDNYQVKTAIAPIEMPFIANNEVAALEVDLGVPVPEQIALITLPDGGQDANNLFLCTGIVNSNGSDLYYSRSSNDTVINQFSYDLIGGLTGTSISLFYLTKPSLWMSPMSAEGLQLSATWDNNDAKLSIDVINESEEFPVYILERSIDGVNFEKISEITPNQVIAGIMTIPYVDKDAMSISAEQLYYRVKTKSQQGNYMYSNTVKLDITKPENISVYPNPVINDIYITTASQNNLIEILDAKGSLVYKKQSNSRMTKLNLGHLAAGNYIIRVQSDDQKYSSQFIKID